MWEVGRVLGPHGVRGEIRIRLNRRDPALLEGGALVIAPSRAFRIEHLRWVDPVTAVVRLSGMADRTAAEAVAGAVVRVDPRLFSGAPPYTALIGAAVVEDGTGREVGRVADFDHNGAQHVLAVEDTAAEERLIPFVPEIARASRDGEGRWVIHVRAIPGLLDDGGEAV